MVKQYPFKFLDAYTREDKDIFFGRKEEVDALYGMVFQSDMLLVYGASGTGKTSLVNCGLGGRFEPHEWLPLSLRRGANLNQSLEKALKEAAGNMQEADMGLNWMEEEAPPAMETLHPLAQMIRAIYLRYFKPVYLIFDQLEELYILGSAEEQAAFIETVKLLLQVEQPLKMIFIIREEYLGHLYAFEKAAPQLLRKKLRVEPMNLDKLHQVMAGVNALPAGNVKLEAGAEANIVEAIFEKIKTREKSLTIQLPYLQVFLDKLYLSITQDESRRADALLGPAALAAMGNIGDVLRQLLEEQAVSIADELSLEFPATHPDTIWQVISPFATLEGTREPMSMAAMQDRLPKLDRPMLNKAIELLVNRRLLRFDDAEEMYELAHDSLALQVAGRRGEEEIALLEAQRIIRSQTALKPEKREYFSEKQLNLLEPLLNKMNLTGEEEDWVEQSRGELRRKRRVRRRRTVVATAFVVLAFTAMALLTAWALSQQQRAEAGEQEAKDRFKEVRRKQAENDRMRFKDLSGRAEVVLDIGGCPDSLIMAMLQISHDYPDSSGFRDELNQFKLKNPKCK